VEAILGRPPGDYRTEYPLLKLAAVEPAGTEESKVWEGEYWETDDGGVLIVFDDGQRVTVKAWLKPKFGARGSIEYWYWKVRDRWSDLSW
jgi:hypothetical protein